MVADREVLLKIYKIVTETEDDAEEIPVIIFDIIYKHLKEVGDSRVDPTTMIG